jgi:hypothetical protein
MRNVQFRDSAGVDLIRRLRNSPFDRLFVVVGEDRHDGPRVCAQSHMSP